jgi:hypothetical protein
MPVEPVNQSSGVAFLVAAGIVYEIIAANCSSPQTTELNAKSRADTLMKWVNIGVGQAAVFVAIAAVIDRKHAKPILVGGALASVVMYASYLHGRRAGLDSAQPTTETWGQA